MDKSRKNVFGFLIYVSSIAMVPLYFFQHMSFVLFRLLFIINKSSSSLTFNVARRKLGNSQPTQPSLLHLDSAGRFPVVKTTSGHVAELIFILSHFDFCC